MISAKFLIFLAIGTMAMLVPLLITGKWNKVRTYQSIVQALCLTIVGTLGTYMMGLLENHFQLGSRSFYGAVFLIPIVFLLVARMLRIQYGTLMDMSAPAICVMLVLMKALCRIEGCCIGRELYVNSRGISVCFPSQIAELCNAIILLVVLMLMVRGGKHRNAGYPWFLILYGISRFVLNFFRANLTAFVWILPAGHFWSLVAILIGSLWLTIGRNKE